MAKTKSSLTQLLVQFQDGDKEALDALMPLVYRELHRIAGAYLRRESSGHTLQPTALVNEAFLRLLNQREVQWQNRSHFFGIAAQLMRRVLLKHAEKKRALKRGGKRVRVSFDEGIHSPGEEGPDIIGLDRALTKLAAIDERQSKIVELRYFAGLGIEEIAGVLDISPATVKREWRLARAWLFRELSKGT